MIGKRAFVLAIVGMAAFAGCSTSTPAKAPEYRSPDQRVQDERETRKLMRDLDREFGPDSGSESDKYDQDPYEGCQYVISC